MTLELSSELEAIVHQRLSTGAYADAEDVVRRALETLEAEEAWTEIERQALDAKTDRAMAEFERGEGIPGDEFWAEFEQRKAAWLKENPNTPA
jgi:antitoxin ParD1/3/4